jgi:hypothetical protein
LCQQDEAVAVSGVVVEFGKVDCADRSGGVGQSALVPPPYIGIWDVMPSLCNSISYSRHAPLGAIEPDKYKVDLIPAGFGPGDQVDSAFAGQRSLDRKIGFGIEIAGDSAQDFAASR